MVVFGKFGKQRTQSQSTDLCPQQRKLMGSSAQKSSGVHWCRRSVRFKEVPEKVPGKVRGGFGRGFRRRFRRRCGRLWCRARLGSTGFRRRLGLVRFNRVPEKVSEKVWEALVQSQVRLNRICGHLIHGNPGEVFPALGFAARFRKIYRNSTLRLLGIPLKFFFSNHGVLRFYFGTIIAVLWSKEHLAVRLLHKVTSPLRRSGRHSFRLIGL